MAKKSYHGLDFWCAQFKIGAHGLASRRNTGHGLKVYANSNQDKRFAYLDAHDLVPEMVQVLTTGDDLKRFETNFAAILKAHPPALVDCILDAHEAQMGLLAEQRDPARLANMLAGVSDKIPAHDAMTLTKAAGFLCGFLIEQANIAGLGAQHEQYFEKLHMLLRKISWRGKVHHPSIARAAERVYKSIPNSRGHPYNYFRAVIYPHTAKGQAETAAHLAQD